MPRNIRRSDAEWRRMLTPEQYRITRQKETEPAHSGWYRDFDGAGTYCCVCCGNRLFRSAEKFKAPSKWPAFWAPCAPESVRTRKELYRFVVRTEVLCSICEAHLGYQVEDGGSPTGRRYLINSIALLFEDHRNAACRHPAPAAPFFRPAR
jgi:peptide-methionine (R)-S-oxide reductase